MMYILNATPVTNDSSVIVAIIAASAVLIGAIISQTLIYLFNERQIVKSEMRNRFVLARLDAILDWGMAIQMSMSINDVKQMNEQLGRIQNSYGMAVWSAYRQDEILKTKWEQCIKNVHNYIETCMNSDGELLPHDIHQKLEQCYFMVSNLLSEIEWWRLYLMKKPMPNRIQVNVRKLFLWHNFKTTQLMHDDPEIH